MPPIHQVHTQTSLVDDACKYATDRKEGYIIRKLERGLAWCERWNVKTNDDKIQAIYFSRENGPAESHLTLKRWNIPFANQIKYFGVIFDRKTPWRYHRNERGHGRQNIYRNLLSIQK